METIVLASGSPRRQELLHRMGIDDFDVRVPQTEETCPPDLSPRETVEYISREKSDAAAAPVHGGGTHHHRGHHGVSGRTAAGQAADEEEALEMLTALQGRHHTVCTGVTVRRGDTILTESESTDVYFRPARQDELLAYIRTGEPMDKAGAYGIQGRGALLVERIDGDFFNVMGLPLLRLSRMLERFGLRLLA